MASRKERLKQTDPFAMPGEKSPALADLTESLITGKTGTARILELEERIAELEATDPENAIIVRSDGMSRHYKDFELRDTELVIPEETNETDWVEIGVLLMRMQGTIQWLLGDWITYGEAQGWDKGVGYARIREVFGYEVESLWSYASVCRKVPALTRVKELSFSHHRAVTKFSDKPDLQQAWLNRALENGWSAKQLIAEIQLAGRPLIEKTQSKPWETQLSRLEDELTTPKKWDKISSEDRREIVTSLQSLLLKLEELGLD